MPGTFEIPSSGRDITACAGLFPRRAGRATVSGEPNPQFPEGQLGLRKNFCRR